MTTDELFPYPTFPVRLEHLDEKRTCWFQCPEHLQKYVERYKLDKKTIKIDYRDGEPPKPGKKQQNSVSKRPRKTSNGSSSGTKRSSKKLDSSGTSIRSTKRKK